VIAMTTLTVGTLAAMTRRVTLRGALLLDAAVTGANGAAYLLAAGPLGDLLGLSPTLLRLLGAVLVAFALAVWLTATRAAVPRGPVMAIVALNAAWAAGSLVLAIGGWASPTTIGTLWIVAQALAVGAFAELQATARRR
jgi:hypothetical protein